MQQKLKRSGRLRPFHNTCIFTFLEEFCFGCVDMVYHGICPNRGHDFWNDADDIRHLNPDFETGIVRLDYVAGNQDRDFCFDFDDLEEGWQPVRPLYDELSEKSLQLLRHATDA